VQFGISVLVILRQQDNSFNQFQLGHKRDSEKQTHEKKIN